MRRVSGFAAALLLTAPAWAAQNESSFTPTSLKVPIWGIYLEPPSSGGGSGGGGGGGGSDGGMASPSPQTLYKCAGPTENDCLVDLADNAALQALFSQATSIAVGTYDAISVATCDESVMHSGGSNTPDYHTLVKGSMTLGGVGGTVYYTHAGADPLTQDQAQQGYVTVGFTGCRSAFPLFAPVMIAENDTLDVSAVVSLKDIAWARLGPSTVPSGCVDNGNGTNGWNDGATQAVCLSYPNLAPYIGNVAPTLETYLVSEPPADATTAGGQVLLVVAPDDHPIGGFTRRYFSETSQQPSASYDTPIWYIGANMDGSYSIKNNGGWVGFTADGHCLTDANGHCIIGDYYLWFPAFTRTASQDGMFWRWENATTAGVATTPTEHAYHGARE